MTEEQEEYIEAEVEETDQEPDIEIITRSDDEEVFRAMDKADEDMVLAELEGRAEALDHYVYSFKDRSGKMITGLSLSGTREAARALALASLDNEKLIQPTTPEPPAIIEETDDFIRVQCTAVDQRTGFKWHGFVEESKFYLDRETGERKNKTFTFVIAMSKAQRNALRGMLPEHWIIQMIGRFIKQGKVKDLSLVQGSGEATLPKGKHAGKTFEEVYEEAPDYLDWCAENWTDKWGDAIRKFLADQQPTKDEVKPRPPNEKISKAWFDRLQELTKQAGMVQPHLVNHLKKHYQVERINDLTVEQAKRFGKHLNEMIEQGAKKPKDEEVSEEETDLYAIPTNILKAAEELNTDDFNFDTFAATLIPPDVPIDEPVQALLLKLIQRLKQGGDYKALGDAFAKGLDQLRGNDEPDEGQLGAEG